MKKQNIINYSPSEFAFGFEACNSCYYDKKINGIELKVPFPGIFSKFDSLQKKFYHGKSSKLLSDKLEEGEIVEECVIFGDRIPAIYDNSIMSRYTYRGLPVPGLPDKCDYVLLMGNGCTYNHSEKLQNIDISQDPEWERIMRVTANKNIKKGKQLYWNYGYDPKETGNM